jgi:membrane-associated phospholipid phosphatase
MWKYAALGAALVPLAVRGGSIPTTPPVNFTNSSTASVGSTIVNLLDSYASLMQFDSRLRHGGGVMEQNIETVVRMTQDRSAAQTLAAIHDDRTAQPYSVLNGLGVLTSHFMTGIGSSTTATPPMSLTPTSYVITTLQDYAPNAQGINYLNAATIGFASFGDGTATPLAGAANFLNNTIRNNASTEPPKRTFERYMGSTGPVTNPASIAAGVISPLDARYGNYSAATNKTALTSADTAQFVVPTYFSGFSVPAAYGSSTVSWVRGFTVTPAMVAANGGKPITVPNVGSYDASGNFTPTTFNAGDYAPGIGAAPRPYRLSTAVNVPTLLWQIINGTNPYADGAFVSGHTNLATNQALGLAFLVPQQYEDLLVRAADLGNNRILAGMHSPLDVIGGRIEATAIAATNIYNALYDANGNRVDWTNPANAAAYAVYQAYTQTQKYLAQSCGTSSVDECLKRARAARDGDHDRDDGHRGNWQSEDFNLDPDDTRGYTYRMTYGLALAGNAHASESVPVQAQVLLLTRFPYLTDEQRTEILRDTALPAGFALLDGNTWDGWGRLNLYAAASGYGSFFRAVRAVTMPSSETTSWDH